MIAEPQNDKTCLGAITGVVAGMVEGRVSSLVELAERYPTTAALADWIRGLPQRDDLAKAGDGPTINQCVPRQRLRIPADDPNCVERAALYLGVGELIDPDPVRSLRTEDTPAGLHTFVVEDGEPVALSPEVTRNALRAAIDATRARGPTAAPVVDSVAIPIAQAIDWIAALAEERGADMSGDDGMVERARNAMHAAARGAILPPSAVREVALTLALAEREARVIGAAGVAVVQRTTETLIARTVASGTTAARNLSVRIGDYTIRPDWKRIGKVGRAAGRIGERAGWLALRSYLGTLGVHPTMLGEIERELGLEGMTLGPLATEPDPHPHSIGAAAVAALGR